MSKKRLGFALVGCGRISKRYVDLFTADRIEQASLVAVCDQDDMKVSAVTNAHADIDGFTDMHEMMKACKDKIDVVCVLSESGAHAQHVCDLAPYGKHIIVEKPMALTLGDADRMIEVCDRHGIRLFVVKQNRFNLPVMKLREAFEAGRFGKIVMGTVRVRWARHQAYYDQDPWRGTWAHDGGVFANQASHHIDLLEWFLGSPVTAVAKTRTALVDIEAEDTGVGIVTFRGGAIGLIEATTATRPKDIEGSLSILGEKGMVEIGGFAVNKMKHWQFEDERPEDADILKNFSENPPDVYGFGHAKYLNHVVHCLFNEKKALVDGLEGRRSLELINALYESAETGKESVLSFNTKRCRLGV